MLFWRFGHVRVRSMIITLRTYLHAHVPFMTFICKVIRKRNWSATPPSSAAREQHNTTG
jgi:hypothetical protein